MQGAVGDFITSMSSQRLTGELESQLAALANAGVLRGASGVSPSDSADCRQLWRAKADRSIPASTTTSATGSVT
jgi:hypothetical protein